MSTLVVLGCADQALSYELRSQLAEVGDVEVAFVAESTQELQSAVLRFAPDVVFLHDELGPQPPLDVMRDLSLRRPGTATVIVSSDSDSEMYAAAMEAGARGVLGYPLSFEEIQARLQTASDWAKTMQRLVRGEGEEADTLGGAKVVAFCGAKGGVGVTTLALHFALDIIHEVRGYRVALVDLDLEKGDVTALIELRYRTSIADLAKVADDLSARTVADAVVPHETGLHILPAPPDVRDVEFVSPQSVRRIIALMRQHYDLIIVDAGSHVTPTQAAVVELADEVIVVTTPDVLALRGLRRQVTIWEQLGVRKGEETRGLVNKASREDEVQPETVKRLAQVPVVSVALPAMHRQFEAAVNSRDHTLVKEPVWFDALRAIGREIGLVRLPDNHGAAAQTINAQATRGQRHREKKQRFGLRRATTKAEAEAGAVSLDFVGIIPWVLLIMTLCWQVGVTALSSVWMNSAATAAAHAAAAGLDPGPAAMDRVPGPFRGNVSVTPYSTSGPVTTVRVAVDVPLVAPGLGTLTNLSTTRKVVPEP